MKSLNNLSDRLVNVENRLIEFENNVLNSNSIEPTSKYLWMNEVGEKKNLFNISESEPSLFAIAVANHLWPIFKYNEKDEEKSELSRYRILENPRNSGRPQMTGVENIKKIDFLKSNNIISTIQPCIHAVAF